MEKGKSKTCSNLENIHLTVATKQFEPFMFIRKNGSETEATGGIDYQFLKLLSMGMSFQYSYTIPDDNEWGVLRENNTWSGLVGLVKAQVADMGVSGLGIDFSRSQAVPFTVPYHFEQISFITTRSLEKSKTFAMVYPFTSTVWACLLFTLLVWTIVIYLTERTHANIACRRRSMRLTSVFWYFFGSLVGKSGNTTRFKAPGIERLLSIWWIAVIAILSFYTSLLTSFITYPGFEAQIESFSQLADAINRDQLEAGTIGGSAPYTVIKNGKSSMLKSLSKGVRKNEAKNLAGSIPEGVKMVTEREYSFIFTKTALENEAYTNYRDKKLFISEDSMYTALGGMAISPRFQCTKLVNKYVKRFLCMGLFSKWKKDLLEVTQRPLSFTKDTQALTLVDLQGPFFLLLLGLLIAFTSFLFEKLSSIHLHN